LGARADAKQATLPAVVSHGARDYRRENETPDHHYQGHRL